MKGFRILSVRLFVYWDKCTNTCNTCIIAITDHLLVVYLKGIILICTGRGRSKLLNFCLIPIVISTIKICSIQSNSIQRKKTNKYLRCFYWKHKLNLVHVESPLGGFSQCLHYVLHETNSVKNKMTVYMSRIIETFYNFFFCVDYISPTSYILQEYFTINRIFFKHSMI